ncbi:FAD-dependent oxidoreductase [Streptomyces sp. GS7]|uniref:FAD-dependent oxidoreductase n=1 Tax=Streptomyces sp. GS7 TaxID=2692234 RepID=UPI0013179756|nr:NAD(P)/FAD-dependent oxidoreductase [Streptomyces sp. GS7]QHC22551.1 NAD(P)-binding protein [Streptomyces sp. GS7]
MSAQHVTHTPADRRSPRIAIVGGGLGGLVCARVLQRHGRTVTVYEREPSPEARSQGGTLDIHADTGQQALRAAGLFDAFSALARPEGQEIRMLDHTATVVRRLLPENEADRPEIDRGQLRDLLLNSLTPGTVRWGAGVDAVAPLDDGTCRVHFTGGATDDFDLVIGADGAWSRVRSALSAARPRYTGVTFVESSFDDCDTRHPGIARLVGHGSMTAKGSRKALTAQRNSNGHIRVYSAFRAPQDWHTALDLTDDAAVRAHLLGRYDGWDESLLALLRDNDGGFVHRPLHALPVPHTWDHLPGVTLLGDAAHLMPPLGVGANLALLDGAELARALVTEPTLDSAVRAYEDVMLPRSAEHATACGEGLNRMITVDDAQEVLFPDLEGMRSS